MPDPAMITAAERSNTVVAERRRTAVPDPETVTERAATGTFLLHGGSATSPVSLAMAFHVHIALH
jgi:hypothetical protein